MKWIKLTHAEDGSQFWLNADSIVTISERGPGQTDILVLAYAPMPVIKG